jgi:PAS domain S-box-containing protein
MTDMDTPTEQMAVLRRLAEETAAKPGLEKNLLLSEDEIRKELMAHQIDLEMQNGELRRALEELEASRERYFEIVDLAPVGYCTLDEHGLILEVNLFAATLFGVDRSAMVNQPVTRFIFPEDLDIFYLLQRKDLMESREPEVRDLRMVKPDGAAFWAHWTVAAARDENGAPVFRIVLSDITRRKQVEEAREKMLLREQSLLSITESAHDGIFRLNSRGGISYWNPAAEMLFGYRREEAVGKKLYDLLVPEPSRTAPHGAGHALARVGDSPAFGLTIELPVRHKDGHEITIAVTLWTVAHDGDGVTEGIVRDITQIKQLEAEILNISDREQQRIGHDLHDGLGQQLTALEMKCFLLQDDLSAEDLAANREQLQQQARQIRLSLQECVRTTREISHSLSPIDLEAGGLMNALARLASLIHVPGKFECQFDCPAPVTLEDPQTGLHLYRIAQETVSNAIKHAGTPRIRIHLGYDEGALLLQVRDWGRGLPEQILQKPGMGLKSMLHRAAAIGASLEFDSKPGGGTTITCRVPLKSPAP